MGIPYPLAHHKPHAGPRRELLDHEPDGRTWRQKDGQHQIPSEDGDFYTTADLDPDADPGQSRSVEAFFGRVDFDGADTAIRYWPAGRDSKVVVDPTRQAGRPSIEGTCIRTAALSGYHAGGDPVDYLARAYDLEVPQVEAAIDFERKLADRSVTAYIAA